jgi:Mrp family chromosome partitioning ATPase
VLDSWYAADAWYRAEAAPDPGAPTPIPAPHAPFATEASRRSALAYTAPATDDLKRLAAHEESEYRLRPAEQVGVPELAVDEAHASHAPKAAVPAETKRERTTSLAPVVYQTSPPADAFSLQQLCTPVQVMSGWESTFSPPATVASDKAPATNPDHSKPPPARASKHVAVTTAAPGGVNPPARTKVHSEPPTAKPTPSGAPAKPAAPVAQLRLDAATAQPVPTPHAAATATTKGIAPAVAMVPPSAERAPARIQPAWEVDRFQWPEHCRQLLSPEHRYLADVGPRLASAAKDGLSILAITSTRRGEGRTTLSLCLARAAAETGVKVALVDADTENPQLVNELGVEASCGWHDVVLGKQPLTEAAILSLEEKFTLFPWTTAGAIKSLNDPQVTRVLKQIAAAYDLVILDLGPAPGRETRLFEDGENCPVDAAILVRDVRWTSALEAQRVAAQLVSAGVESVGIAENFGPRN